MILVQENKIRGFCDAMVLGVDFINKAYHSLGPGAPLKGLEHLPGYDFGKAHEYSSEEFLEKNLTGKTGESAEEKLNYWLGALAFDCVSSEFFWGPAVKKTATAGKAIFSKVFKEVGVKAALASKLTSGALVKGSRRMPTGFYITGAVVSGVGKGIHLIVPRTAGASYRIRFDTRMLNAYGQEVASKASAVSPQFSKFIKQSSKTSIAFINEAFRQSGISSATASGIALNSFYQSKSGHELKKAEIKAYQDIQEVATANLEENSALALKAQDILVDLSEVIDHSGEAAASFENYENFIVRCQVRDLFANLDFSPETIHHVMKKIPHASALTVDILEKSIEKANCIERTLNYCERNNVCEWVKNKLLQLSLPMQKHYVFSDKSMGSQWTARFKEVFEKYGLESNGHWNLLLIPRQKIVAEAYHDWAFSEVERIDAEIKALDIIDKSERQKLFLELFQTRIKDSITSNPLICAHKWYRFWKNDKQVFEQKQGVQAQVVGEEISNPALLPDTKPVEKTAVDTNNFKPVYKLHKDLQLRHFKEYGAVDNEKSLVYWDCEKIRQKTESLIGKGIATRGSKLGDEGFQEVVKFDEVCGEAYLIHEKEWVITQFAKIHHRLDGKYHIVPENPNGQGARKWEQLYENSET